MLALSPPLFSTIGWPLEDHPISLDHNNYFSAESSLLHFPTTLQPQFDQLDHSTPSTAISSESNISSMAKKLNHNASERDRRKKINNLYSSLRSLVPADHAKKLSIPATVSRVLKYIPELQQQVEGLIQKRDELLSKISQQENVVLLQEEKQVKSTARRSRSSLSAVSTTRLSDGEVTIQISTINSSHNFISRILQSLEEDGLELLNASSFESSGGRIFYNLHLQWNVKSRAVYRRPSIISGVIPRIA
nr:basic helix-loop-helix family protein [Rosa persica]